MIGHTVGNPKHCSPAFGMKLGCVVQGMDSLEWRKLKVQELNASHS